MEDRVEKNLEDLSEEVQNILLKGKRLMNNWWDAWFPISEADSDRNFGRKNPNNNNFKRKSLRAKCSAARERIDQSGFESRTSGGRPSCALYRTEDNPDYSVILIGMFNANFGNWNDEGNFVESFNVNL